MDIQREIAKLTSGIALHTPTTQQALLAHARLSRAAWEAIITWEADICSISQMTSVIAHLREVLEQSIIRCTCDPPLSGEEWCTHHCQMAQEATDTLREGAPHDS